MERLDGGQARKRWDAFMDAASTRLQAVAGLDADAEEVQCARHVIQSPRSWRRWESELGISLRPVANFRSRMLQARALRQAGCSWVHRAAPFRYMRAQQLRGERRRRLVLGLRSQASFARAMVVEHDVYIRSVCHGFCAAHLGHSMLGDPLFRESMQRYQGLYMDYFHAFCATHYPEEGSGDVMSAQLLPMLKLQLAELRHAILEYPLRSSWLQREVDIRRPTGDTQQLPHIGPKAQGPYKIE